MYYSTDLVGNRLWVSHAYKVASVGNHIKSHYLIKDVVAGSNPAVCNYTYARMAEDRRKKLSKGNQIIYGERLQTEDDKKDTECML